MAKTTLTRKELKAKVDALVPKLPQHFTFIAGARKIKDDQTEFEFVQSRNLTGRKASLLALMNKGDDRFSTGRITMRVWMMGNLESMKELFGHETELNFVDIFKKVAESKGGEDIVAVLKGVETINVEGKQQPVLIRCRETIDVETLPKAIREQILDPNTEEEYKQRYILQTAEGEKIVDEAGNTVYRIFVLDYGTDANDEIIPNKQLKSDYAKKVAAGGSVTKRVGNETLASALES